MDEHDNTHPALQQYLGNGDHTKEADNKQKVPELKYSERVRITNQFMRHFLRFRNNKGSAEALELICADLKEAGIKDEAIQGIKQLLIDYDEVRRDDTTSVLGDRLLTGGLLAINLIILQALISLGNLDLSSVIALVALCVSIPTSAGFLFIRFVQERYKIINYDWPINSIIPTVSGIFGLIGITAAIWHASPLAGVVFLIISLVIIVICGSYYYFVAVRDRRKKRSQTTQSNSTDEV